MKILLKKVEVNLNKHSGKLFNISIYKFFCQYNKSIIKVKFNHLLLNYLASSNKHNKMMVHIGKLSNVEDEFYGNFVS